MRTLGTLGGVATGMARGASAAPLRAILGGKARGKALLGQSLIPQGSRKKFEVRPTSLARGELRLALGASLSELGSYSPHNASVYDAALGGFASGIFQARYPDSPSYTALAEQAALFAQALDAEIAPATIATEVVNLIGEFVANVIGQRWAAGLPLSAYEEIVPGILLAIDTFASVMVPTTPPVTTSVQVVRYNIPNSGSAFPAQTSPIIQVLVDQTGEGGPITIPLPASLIDGTIITAYDDAEPGLWGEVQPIFTVGESNLINNPSDTGVYAASVSPPALAGNSVSWCFDAVKGLYV